MFKKSWAIGGKTNIINCIYDKFRNKLNHQIINFIFSIIDKDRLITSLEAGSGIAYGSSILKGKKNVRISTALDIELETLKIARLRDPNLPVIQADLYALPIKDSSFNLIWNNSTLEHLESVQNVLAEIRRILVPDGFIFIGLPYKYGPLGIQKIISKTNFGEWIGEVRSEEEIKDLLFNCGFKPVEWKNFFFNFFIGVVATKYD